MKIKANYWTRIPKKIRLVVALVVATLVGGLSTSVVMASIPSSDGTISSCYNNLTGSLRVIDTDEGASCNGLETPLSWSQGENTYSNVVTYNIGDVSESSPATILSIPNLADIQVFCDSTNGAGLLVENTTDSTIYIDGGDEPIAPGQSVAEGSTNDEIFSTGSPFHLTNFSYDLADGVGTDNNQCMFAVDAVVAQ